MSYTPEQEAAAHAALVAKLPPRRVQERPEPCHRHGWIGCLCSEGTDRFADLIADVAVAWAGPDPERLRRAAEIAGREIAALRRQAAANRLASAAMDVIDRAVAGGMLPG